jgi:hypothetical protein
LLIQAYAYQYMSKNGIKISLGCSFKTHVNPFGVFVVILDFLAEVFLRF